MMNVYDNRKSISNYFLSITKRINEIDGKTRNYGTDTPLYNSEVHIIKSVREHEGIYITALANLLEVTKGSISEIIKKLEKKDMIVKKVADDNLSKLCLFVTDKGRIAYQAHEDLHRKFEQEIENVMNMYPKTDRELIVKVLSQIDSALDTFQE